MRIRVGISLLIAAVFYGYIIYAGVRVLLEATPVPLLEHASNGMILTLAGMTTLAVVAILLVIFLPSKSKQTSGIDDDDEPWGTIVHDFTGHGSPRMPYVPDLGVIKTPGRTQAPSPR